MAELIWTEPALQDLQELAEYISIENPQAAQKLIQSVFSMVETLIDFPYSGRKPPELPETEYREKVVQPVRIFYRVENDLVYIVHIMRSERDLRNFLLK
ncbi:MAG: toxin ParE1/3/4 [Candidatus Promineifilaceae bacterium]|jgi:toxin ParE1/3/4